VCENPPVVRPTRTRRRLWALLGPAALLLAACSQPYPYNSLAPAGPVAQKQKDLYLLVFWIAVVVFVLVEGALVYAAIRFRRRRADELPVQVHGNTRLEIIWTILPALLLAGIAVPTVAAIFDLARAPTNAVQVTVTGNQWWWHVRYPNGEGLEDDVVTANEIHIPVGRPVLLTLTSRDVIHSFKVPRLAGTQDLIPGRTETLTFQADIPGTYQGECAEYCGESHANMRFIVVAEPASEFETWLADQGQAAAEPPEGGDPAAGLEVFSNPLPQGPPPGSPFGACIGCHAVEGVGGGDVGPDLTHFGSRKVFAGGILENTPENVARWLRNPDAVKAGSKMPNYRLTEDQIEDLVAYLESLE
jgi:cytochrome c oxidase subunit II